MEWISVKDRLPSLNKKFGESDYVLCFTETQEMVVCWYNKHGNWTVATHKADSLPYNRITHWMPLPKDPKQ